MLNNETTVRFSASRGVDAAMILFLAGLFGFAAVDKLFHASGFVRAIDSYSLLPVPMGSVLAPVIIAAELAIAIGLLRKSWRATASLQGAILMTVFTVGLAANRLSGQDALCGCWFSISMAQGDAHFLLNGILIAMSLLVWRATNRLAPRALAELA